MDKERIVSDSQRTDSDEGRATTSSCWFAVDSPCTSSRRRDREASAEVFTRYVHTRTLTHTDGGMAAASSSSSSSSIMASSMGRSARASRHGRRAGNSFSGGKAASMARSRRALVARAAKEFTVELEKPLGMKLGQKPGKVRANCCRQWPDGLLPSRPSSDE